MKKVVTEDPVNFPPGMLIGLNQNQAKDRSHILSAAEGVDLPDGYQAFTTKEKTQFKAGEVLFVEKNLPKTMVQHVVDVESGTASESEEKLDSKKQAAEPKKPAAKKK